MRPTTRSRLAATIATAAALATGAAEAQVWRCGNSYSKHPCDDGRLIDTDDPRSQAQQHEADAAARRNAAAADALEQDRLRLEAAAARAPAVIAAPARAASASRAARPPQKRIARQKNPEYFTARGPDTKRRKALEDEQGKAPSR